MDAERLESPSEQVAANTEVTNSRLPQSMLCMTNSARLGDHNRPYYCVRSIHRVYGHPDSISIRLWRGANRRSAAGLLHSAGHRRPTGCACVDYRRWHSRSARLETDPPGEHRLARALQPFWYPFGSFASDE